MADAPSRRRLLASLGALALAGCTASPDDGPAGTSPTTTPTPTATPTPPASVDAEWPRPANDHGRSNYSSDAAGPTEPVAELWRVPTGTPLSGPVLADETVYVGGDDGDVRAFDARTGGDRWRTSVGTTAGTPRAMADRLYVPTAAGIVALRAGDGGESWRVAVPDLAALLVAPHGIYYVSDADDPAVVGLGVDGGERWRGRLRDPWTPTLFATDEQVFVSTGTHYPVPLRFAADTGEFLAARPYTEGGHHFPGERFALDDSVYAGDPFYGSLSAYDATGRSYDRRWTADVGQAGGGDLAAGADHVYARERPAGVFYALSVTDGRTDWEIEGVARLSTRPVVAGDAVLVLTEEQFRCFDPTDGSERWSRPADVVGPQFVVADDLVYTTAGSTVRALRPP